MLVNPVNDDTVLVVTIQSAYYQAWSRYFEGRVGAETTVDHAANTVTIKFTGGSVSGGANNVTYAHISMTPIVVSNTDTDTLSTTTPWFQHRHCLM